MPKTIRHQNKDGSIWYHRREKLGTWQWWTLKPEPFSWVNPKLEKDGWLPGSGTQVVFPGILGVIKEKDAVKRG